MVTVPMVSAVITALRTDRPTVRHVRRPRIFPVDDPARTYWPEWVTTMDLSGSSPTLMSMTGLRPALVSYTRICTRAHGRRG